jgi:hypothetical protein
MKPKISAIVLLFAIIFGAATARADTPPPAKPDSILKHDTGRFRSYEDDGLLKYISDDSGRTSSLIVEDKDLKKRLKGFQEHDRLIFEIVQQGDHSILNDIRPVSVAVSRIERTIVLSAATILFILLVWVLLRSSPSQLVVGYDNRYSNSKLQVAVWFTILLVTYLATIYLRWIKGNGELLAGVQIPDNLALLSGISAFTFAAAKGITTAKVDDAQARRIAAGVPANNPLPNPDAGQAAVAETLPVKTKLAPCEWSFFRDLLNNDQGKPDLGDTQMFIITLLAMAVYLAEVVRFLGDVQLVHTVTLPDIDSTLLTTFGVGQGAYLAKKGLGRVGES